jgi:S-DNA-T family DNA segregation ATPase FtsK/SpoIIIE
LIAFGLVTLVSLAAFGKAGALGSGLATALGVLFGLGSYLVPFLLIGAGAVLIYGQRPTSRAELIGGGLALWLVFLAWWDYAHPMLKDAFNFNHVAHSGGLAGAALNLAVSSLLGVTTPILYFALLVMAVVWLTDMRLLHMIQNMATGARRMAEPVQTVAAKVVTEKRRRNAEEKADTGIAIAPDKPVRQSTKAAASRPAPPVDDDMPTIAAVPKFVPLPPVKAQTIVQKPLNLDRLGETVDSTNANYQLPPLDILVLPPPPNNDAQAVNQERQKILMRTLNDFKIGANVKQVAMGPTVTRYEVELEPGILVKKIVALADNLAMSLAAIDVRVEAPIPGKAAIGIEVPNEVPQIVTLRECLDTAEFVNAPSKLTFALGKDVAGNFKYADLTKMPHVLVGGTTNSGKSSCLNSLISSLVYRATPREVRFVMIDPKRVELSLYDGIPHLLAPVIKDTKQAAGILRSVLQEMEKRYTMFAEKGTRNIDGFNGQVEEKKRLPYIVVVIDELADLMMTQGPEVETCICRLAQLARATGIHLVIATQRPSVDVVTGTIKANISSRIAFAVATQIDSRTILDTPGADRLIGRGDMLYLPIDANKPLRVQGCYVTEKETVDLVKYLKDQEAPNYTMIPSSSADGFSDDGEGDDGDHDELFEPAVRWLTTQHERGASTSSLQRKFKIGYTRAARLIECMEARGIVGSQDGVKPREVLLHPGNVDSYFDGRQQGVVSGNMAYPDDDEDITPTPPPDNDESPF